MSVKDEQALRSSLPALSRQILELAKTRKRNHGQKNKGFNWGKAQHHAKRM
jgi:hypothetical protein